MKLVLCFSAIFVVVSHQQLYERSGYKFPWYPQIQRQFDEGDSYPARNRFDDGDYYSATNRFDDGDYYPATNRFIEHPLNRYNPFSSAAGALDEGRIDLKFLPGMEYGPIDTIQGRIKGLKGMQSTENQRQRFLFGGANNGNNNNNNLGIGRPLVKTATFLLTSTCTALSVVNCIPALYVTSPTPCARKRHVNLALAPAEVQIITQTKEVSPDSMREERSVSTDVASSKTEAMETNTNAFEAAAQLGRMKRFYYLWQQFVTGVTSTSWSVLSITSTKTFTPSDTAGAAVSIFCIPPGYVLC